MSLYNVALACFSSCTRRISKNRNEREIKFIYGERLYLFSCEGEKYFRLTLPNVLDVDRQTGTELLLGIMKLNEKIKVAKATLVEGKLWLSYESFVYSMENLDIQLMRAIMILRQYYEELANLVKSSGI